MSENVTNEILDIENLNISEEELPTIVSERLDAIVEIDKQIKQAEANCLATKEKAEKMIIAKVLNKREAINSTQDAVRSLAEAQSASQDAQRMLFENQQKMADGMRYLLALGASSIAMNKVVITELEAKLKQAEVEELSENAREELLGVIRLLREQESTFSRQDRMSSEIKKHGREIEAIHHTDNLQNETDRRHDAMLTESLKRDAEQDAEIERRQKVDEVHESELKKLKMISYIGSGVAIVALILSIIGLFI